MIVVRLFVLRAVGTRTVRQELIRSGLPQVNPISIAEGLDNQIVKVEYKGSQNNVYFGTQGESILEGYYSFVYVIIILHDISRHTLISYICI